MRAVAIVLSQAPCAWPRFQALKRTNEAKTDKPPGRQVRALSLNVDSPMGDIINLRRVKKAQARKEAQMLAETNRTKHGTPKATRNAAAAEKTRATRGVESHRLDKD
jgi:Domain of unknown function (DUF4169)